LIAAAGLSASSLFAQSVATDPVGALSYSLKQGSQLTGISLVKPAVSAGSISAVNTLTITVSGSPNVGAALTTGAAYYLEVVKDTANSGTYTGDRFEVDTAATKAGTVGTVVLKSSAENTISGNPPSALVGAQFVVRPHLTLGGILTDMTGSFLPGDKITIRENGGSSITATLNGAGTTWQAGLTNKNSLIIYPGVGFFVVRGAATTTSGVLVGAVRTNSFVQVLKSGNQVLSEGFPMDTAPSPTAGIASRLFTNLAGGTFASGDKLTAYNPSGVLTTYTYSTSNNRWSAGLTNGTALNLFHPTTASFVTLANANPNYVQLMPFSL
jgi:hypothetical protein